MNGIMKHWSMKKSIALLLVVTITCVYVIGDKFSFVTSSKGNEENSQSNVSVGSDNLRPISELNLAETDTEIGKVSELLEEGYEKLVVAYADEKDFNTAMSDFAQLVSTLKDKVTEELDITDNGTDEYNSYRSEVLSGFKKLENCISEQSEKNSETLLNQMEEIIFSEKPYLALADDLPFNNVSNEEVQMETYTGTEPIAYEAGNENDSESDLEFTNDVVINDEIRSEFADLSGVLEIYQYIKNNYMPEFYYGSRKGSVGAFEEKAGNDYDLSSLLIAVLRDREIPAHYVRGEIEITAEQAMDWTAADNINAALRMIGALGIPVTGLTKNGDIVAARLEHVWVEAYVPYTDYRGAGNQSGESLWIPLDVSFKELNHLEGIDLTSLIDYLIDESNFLTSDSEIYGVNVGQISTEVGEQNSAFAKYILENGYGESTRDEVFGGHEIVYEDLGYLPLTLPYDVVEKMDSFGDIPPELTDSISFSLIGNSAYELEFTGSKSINKMLYTPDLYGKRVVLAYTPASEADEAILEQYGGIFKTPAYLLKLKPQLIIDGEVVAEGSTCNAGYMQKYTINIHNGSPNKNDSKVENSVVAGGIYCIALDYGTISADELQKSADNMEALKETVSEDNIYTDMAMGEMLNSVAKAYFAQLDMFNAVVAGQNNVTSTREMSIGIVGFNVNVVYTFNRPAELNEGGIFLDIGHDVHSVVSNGNDNDNEKTYMLQAGIYASAMEHGILEQITGVESVSTIKVLEYAAENDIPIHTIAKENIASEISTLDISEQVKQEISSSVNAGKVVIIPEQEIEINQWTGIGYMVLDPDTFACAYMISGGLAGGSMTAGQVIGEYVQYVIQGLVTIVLYELAKAAILALLPFGWVSYAFIAFEIIMFVNWLCGIVDLFNSFAETGDIRYLQEALIQIAAAATIAAVMPAIKPKLEQLKDSITETISNLKQTPEYSSDSSMGGCFVAGTLILESTGLVPIETISKGDIVLSYSPETKSVTQKTVEETFVRESLELVYIDIGNEIITTTPEHPFYVMENGFVEAIKLCVGDALLTEAGDCLTIKKMQHETLESPVKVYNFKVADTHTYFVGKHSVCVHNIDCGESGPDVQKIKRINGNKNANKFVKQFGYEGEKAAEMFKKDIVGNAGSRFNIIYDKGTGKVYLETVQSPHKYVPTGYTIGE